MAVKKKIVETIKDIGADLGLGKSPLKVENERKKTISDIAAENMKLHDKMLTISFKSKTIPVEKLAKDQKMIAFLATKLEDEYSLVGPDTRAIDEKLYELCDELKTAYESGDKTSAHYIVETIAFGIMTGHKPLTVKEQKNEAKVMERRFKKLETYIKICETAKLMFQKGLVVEKNIEILNESVENLKVQRKDVVDFENANPYACQLVEDAGGYKNDLTGEAFDYVNKMQKATRTFERCESLKKQISLDKMEIDNFNDLILSLEGQLNVMNEDAKQSILEYVNEASNEFMQRVDQQFTDIIATDKTITKINTVVGSVFDSQRVKGYTSEISDRFQQMMQYFENVQAAEAAAEAAGRKKHIIENGQINENGQGQELEQDN